MLKIFIPAIVLTTSFSFTADTEIKVINLLIYNPIIIDI